MVQPFLRGAVVVWKMRLMGDASACASDHERRGE